MNRDFIVTSEAAVSRYACADGLARAAPLLPCRFTALLHLAKTPTEVGYCVWALRLDTSDGANKRAVRFILARAKRVAHHAQAYPAVQACITLVERWLAGEDVSPDQLRAAAFAASAAAASAAARAAACATNIAAYAAARAANIAASAAARAAAADSDFADSADAANAAAAGADSAEREAQRQDLLAIYEEAPC